MVIKKTQQALYQTYRKLDILRLVYRRLGYHFAGVQAVVKPCHWLKKSLLTRGKSFCYKQLWYGIPSHRCLQMSPVIVCNFQCLYCWRAHESDLHLTPIDPKMYEKIPYDPPKRIVDETLRAWRSILAGFKGNPKVDPKMFEEALNPIHVTLSLTGEPTLYPWVGEVIDQYFKQGFKSVFLVTNGSMPQVLRELKREPSQLYVTVPAPDKHTFRIITRPLIPDAWERLVETLRELENIRPPTVIRLTLVKGLSLKNPEKYAELISLARPTYVEVKAAMSVGYFRRRLNKDNMPKHAEIKQFAEKLSDHLRKDGYKIIGEFLPSRVVLLSTLEQPMKIIGEKG
ncbi:MAG: 4-demethylwyosine synthase TYW1 [Thermoprotei archaeon]|nr:MAG: 4-demethylwyosine synthase TYW1 [Thermoprotei archaeon]